MRKGAPGPHNVGAVDAFIEGVQASGRLTFSLEEVSVSVATSGRALEAALRRRTKAGVICRVAPKTGFFVVVPPEHRSMGCPPVEWWLHDLMVFLDAPYYLGLLSAAALHGSAHFAVMETQVVTSAWLRPISAGRNRLRFFQRRNLEAMPTETRQGDWAPLRIATPETVAVDLLRYGACGVDKAALALSEMPKRLDRGRLLAALEGGADTPTAQRLGYILEWTERPTQAAVVRRWLDGRTARDVTLQPGSPSRVSSLLGERWRVRGEMPEGTLA